MGVAHRDDSVARPHWASHPLPFLDNLPVGLQDALADAGERFAAPVCESCDQLVNTFRWIHWILCLEFLSKSAAEGHGLSTSKVPKGELQGRRHAGQNRRTLEFLQTDYKCNRV